MRGKFAELDSIKGPMICPKCGKEGYLNKKSRKYFQVTHNIKSGSNWTTKHCYLGRVDKKVYKLYNIAKTMPERISPELVEQVLAQVKKNPSDDLTLRLLYQLMLLGMKFTDSIEHKLRYKDKCPHCSRPLAIYITHVGGRKRYHVKSVWLDTWKIY